MTNQINSEALEFKHLFTPLRIGSFIVRNRILSTAHGTGYAENGLPSERHLNYWASKAKGGIGLVLTHGDPVHHIGPTYGNCIELWRDEIIPPFRRIAEAVHEQGARIVAQLNHLGFYTPTALSGNAAWAASTWKPAGVLDPPHEMTPEEIHEMVDAFAAAAQRIKEAGLDGVEIHCAHGYLLEQFLSPWSNKRDDDYGGDEERRMRFPLEVIGAVRSAVGSDFTVGIRISGDEFEPDGLTLDDMRRIAPWLVEAGKLDYVNVSFKGPTGAVIAPMYVEPGQYVYLAAGIKQVVDVPVFCVERITNPVLAEQILARHEADMVGMTRANIADPDLANKAREGRLDEIRYCIGINEGCSGRLGLGLPITCAINPAVGREAEMEIRPAAVQRRVMVVGGGIAGMEAARVAAARGHSVTLWEKEPSLGGQLQVAAKAPGRGDMLEPVRYYTRQFEILGVDVRLNANVDEAVVQRESPDALILATGGVPTLPPIAGVEDGRADGIAVVLARDALAGVVTIVGHKVVVFATDQGMEGLTAADYLAEQGKQVEIIIPFPMMGMKVEGLTGMMLRGRLAKNNVKISVMTGIKEVRSGVITALELPGGPERRIEGVETLVVSAGSRANDGLVKALRNQVKEIYPVGECLSPRKLLDSTLDGLRAGLKV